MRWRRRSTRWAAASTSRSSAHGFCSGNIWRASAIWRRRAGIGSTRRVGGGNTRAARQPARGRRRGSHGGAVVGGRRARPAPRGSPFTARRKRRSTCLYRASARGSGRAASASATLKLGPVDTPMTASHGGGARLFARANQVAADIVTAMDIVRAAASSPGSGAQIVAVVRRLPERLIQRLPALSGRWPSCRAAGAVCNYCLFR